MAESRFENLVLVAAKEQWNVFQRRKEAAGYPRKVDWDAVGEEYRAMWLADQRAALEAIELPWLLDVLAKAVGSTDWSCDVNGSTGEPCGECVGCSLNKVIDFLSAAS